MDLDYATATELTRAIRDRELSSRELLSHVLTRVEQRNPGLNAIVVLDADRAQAAADAADQATARDEATGLLHGLPMTVKDVWETEGLVTTAGAAELKEYVPAADALAVARLKSSGRHHLRQVQHTAVCGRLPDVQRRVRDHPQPVGSHPHRRGV